MANMHPIIGAFGFVET